MKTTTRPDSGGGGSTVLTIEEIVRELRTSGKGHRSVAGFALAASLDPRSPDNCPRGLANRIADGFVGPEAPPSVRGASAVAQWAIATPGPEQRLSTLSYVETGAGFCVVEGEFYSAFDDYRPKAGSDDRLAHLVLHRLEQGNLHDIQLLNATFCGTAILRDPLRVYLFVDRLGVRFLYYRRTPGILEVSTNVYGFRHGMAIPTVDPQALHEHLILGYPTESNTLFANIHLVPPSTVVEISPKEILHHRYFDLPERRTRISLHDAVRSLCSAIDTHVADVPVGDHDFSLAFSGGKDSRAVLSSLRRCGKQARAIVYSTGDDDTEAQLASTILERVGVPRTTVTLGSTSDPSLFDLDSSLLEDGYAAGWGFLATAGASSLLAPALMTGYSGDPISGYWSGILPWKMRSLDDLARAELEHRGEEVPGDLLREGLQPHLQVPYEAVIDAWLRSFQKSHSDNHDFTSTFLRQRFAHRNRRRIGVIFRAMRLLASPIHPFADARVLDAYCRLPYRLLVGQHAHCYVAFHGVPSLGDYPTGGVPFPIPLRHEARFAVEIHHGMKLLRKLRAVKRTLRSAPPSAPLLTPRHARHLHIAAESGLFKPEVLRAWYESGKLSGNAVIKLGATALHIGCATGNVPPSAPEPLFVKGL